MAPLWFIVFLFVPSLAVAQAPLPGRVNRTELHQAMADMQVNSYHGFVLLLKLLNALPSSTLTTGTTFLMPSNDHLAQVAFTKENLHDFIASHSIPFALTMRDMLHFPNGSLVPSGSPKRMLHITNDATSTLIVNNARIVAPNICAGTTIMCHGISAPISFNATQSSQVTEPRLDSTLVKNMKMHQPNSRMMDDSRNPLVFRKP